MPVTRRYPPVTGIMPPLYFNQRKSIMSKNLFTTEEMLLAMEFCAQQDWNNLMSEFNNA